MSAVELLLVGFLVLLVGLGYAFFVAYLISCLRFFKWD